MKVATMMAALVAMMACVVGNAFVVPSGSPGTSSRSSNALAPAANQPTSSRSTGESRRSCMAEDDYLRIIVVIHAAMICARLEHAVRGCDVPVCASDCTHMCGFVLCSSFDRFLWGFQLMCRVERSRSR